ncbi:MAG TPA: hypothetical protein VIT38_07095 [Allosphingosinicella sp.]
MDPLIEEVVEALRGIGWQVEPAATARALPAAVAARHPNLPPLALAFFTGIESCVSDDEGRWLLAAADYGTPAGSDGFAWDEFERMFADDPEDEREKVRIHAFWDKYLPIFQLVSGDYEYLAIGTDPGSDQFGKIVWGDVIDYDQPTVVASSYESFLEQVRDVASRVPTRSAVYDNDLTRLIHTDIIEDGVAPPWEGWWARLRRRLRGGN